MQPTSSELLQRIQTNLVEMTALVQSAMSTATAALLSADVRLAEQVIADDARLDTINATVETTCLEVLADRHLPSADIRAAVAAMRMATTLERMGDLAAHVAKQARLRFPNASVPAELQATFAEMGELANAVVAQTGEVIATRDIQRAAGMAEADAQMDAIHRQLFAIVLDPNWRHGVEAAIDVTLLSRYYERFADHAISVAKRVAFVVNREVYGTSELPTAAGVAQ